MIDNYSIHQLEPMVMLMGSAPSRVMVLHRGDWAQMMFQWADGRCTIVTCSGCNTNPFTAVLLTEEDGIYIVQIAFDYFGAFQRSAIHFFETGEIPVSHEETIAIAATREAALLAYEVLGTWVAVPVEKVLP